MTSTLYGKKREILFSAFSVLLTVVSLAPLVFPTLFATEISDDYGRLFKIALLVIPVAAVAFCYGVKIDCSPRQKVALFILLVLLSALLVAVHVAYVDRTQSNHQWQLMVQDSVMELSPSVIPHSYRFLPNSMVRVMDFFTGDFSYARSLYRYTFMFLLLFSIYYYARLYCSHKNALMPILFYAMVYPVSIRYYSGQLTDPLSHLSFVLAFIFLELDLFICFASTVTIGILAKESIIIMVAYALLLRWKEQYYLTRTLFLFAGCAAITMFIRLWVVPAESAVNDVFVISNLKGTALPHIISNVMDVRRWSVPVFLTVGVFLPFLIFAWKSTREELKNLAIFLLPTLLLSNLLFGWLVETRNLVPAVIPLAIITADYLMDRFRGKDRKFMPAGK